MQLGLAVTRDDEDRLGNIRLALAQAAAFGLAHHYDYPHGVASFLLRLLDEERKKSKRPPAPPLIFVTYDDAANGVLDVQGNITNVADFCRAIEQGRIKNVRISGEPPP